jgi:DNA repair exonuclease SbcCD ATPase subunit
MGLMTGLVCGQEFKTPVSEYQVDPGAKVVIEASYSEIEIEEWNKNKVEIQGVMEVQGLNEAEAKGVFDAWQVESEERDNIVSIHAESNSFGNEYFFIHNDKYLGNVVVDIPEVSKHVLEALDSIHIVLPEISEFTNIDFDFDFSTNLDYESLNFDYEAFKENSEYLREWQERNREQLKRLREELKERHLEMAEQQKEMQKRVIVIQEQARMEAEKEVEKQAKVAEKEAREVEEQMRMRQDEIQRILDRRQKIKVKRILKVKVPKSAKLEMDVDYCKITTVN